MSSTAYCCANDKDSHVFSIFLRNTRQHNDLSQEQLCLHLREQSSLFYNLDTITVSRWERGVNIPSLAKQAEIVELYNHELVDIYGKDNEFLNECTKLLALPINKRKSSHPYYSNDEYIIKDINNKHPCFHLILAMILQYEGNPCLSLEQIDAKREQLSDLNISVASAFGGQIVGHCLFIETTSQQVLELLNFKISLQEMTQAQGVGRSNAVLVLSSAGATTQIENSLMSIYMNYFVRVKQLTYLAISTCDDVFNKKLNRAKLVPFKVKSISETKKKVDITSFLISRSEVMANSFLLKLSVISPSKLSKVLAVSVKGK
ncbi:helix-turn-helix transcriptional regulator [Shewanella sp. UCD-KL12]|uniref:helix-turn-helix domain-containing protein n=1 Tax=Shewanella sp. UCD-KL12 TaxID=1917163 RepID=UPI001C4C5CFD|nr:helix-turn-helix transcriptional regulator [Shewanella sp. UCD-KL12]